jgi:hypothetical protein
MTTVEVSPAVQHDVYDPDDVGLRDSPMLKALKPKLQPTPSPSPEASESEDTKPVPSQGDAVLIQLLGGGKALEVARTAATQLLPADDEMDEQEGKGVEVSAAPTKTALATQLEALAAGALNAVKYHTAHADTAPYGPEGAAQGDTTVAPRPNGHGAHHTSEPLPAIKSEPSDNGGRHLSPTLFNAHGGEELAPIQEASPKSEKANEVTLPSIAQLTHLKQLADVATATSGEKDLAAAHHSSIPQSPHVPSLFPLGSAAHPGPHTSPPISPNDNFRRELPSPGRAPLPAAPQYHYSNPRRPSAASEAPHFPAVGPYEYSSSTTETPSTDQSGSTPAGIPAAVDRMSIDGITNPQIGGFQCTYPGCSAQPFQTHYLLNSHANVHSSNRPHYCPVEGCPRGEGGKGFKRKNEMIRHGLVHESPGYVCPYCVDREHRYPRPDNLQRSVLLLFSLLLRFYLLSHSTRHVRVHHVDKDKDDPQLREVLSQRPEGPSRGRRRRGGHN